MTEGKIQKKSQSNIKLEVEGEESDAEWVYNQLLPMLESSDEPTKILKPYSKPEVNLKNFIKENSFALRLNRLKSGEEFGDWEKLKLITDKDVYEFLAWVVPIMATDIDGVFHNQERSLESLNIEKEFIAYGVEKGFSEVFIKTLVKNTGYGFAAVEQLALLLTSLADWKYDQSARGMENRMHPIDGDFVLELAKLCVYFPYVATRIIRSFNQHTSNNFFHCLLFETVRHPELFVKDEDEAS